MKKFLPHTLFVSLLAIVSFIYGYHETVFKKPQSIHKWRQADCASIALNYYQGNMNLFKPEVHNLTADSGRSGKCYPSEVPILSYAVACLYKVAGYHDWVYRGFNMLIFFCGLFFLFRLLLYLLKDVFWALAIPLLLFTSPILVFYANNFPVNSTALALSLIAWYYFTRFLFEAERKWFYRSLIFLFLAGCLKVTAFFSLFAFGGIYLFELIRLKNFGNGGKLFPKEVKFLLWVPLTILPVVAWLKFANDYNAAHDCTYFSTTVFPFWSLNEEEKQRVFDNIKNIWLGDYFHFSTLIFIGICFLYCVIRIRKLPVSLRFILLLILLEAVVYVLLQFRQFADHDYYVIDLYIIPVLILVFAFYILKQDVPKVFSSFLLKPVFALFLMLNIFYAKGKVNARYDGVVNDYPANADFYTVTPYLRQLGITPEDTVISIPDMTHVSLYLMNQKGWTEYTDARLNRSEPIPYNADSAGIQLSINKGAKYLILNGAEELYKKPYLQKFTTCLIGKYNRILVFKLKDKKDNFSLDQRKVKQRYFCNADTLTEDKADFKGIPLTEKFAFGRTQTDSLALSGKFSCRLSKENPYGMTLRLKGASAGESFVISAWRKTGTKEAGTIIVSADSTFYDNEIRVLEKNTSGWEKITKEIFITKELAGKELTVYIYSPDIPVLFDDLEILWYESIENALKNF